VPSMDEENVGCGVAKFLAWPSVEASWRRELGTLIGGDIYKSGKARFVYMSLQAHFMPSQPSHRPPASTTAHFQLISTCDRLRSHSWAFARAPHSLNGLFFPFLPYPLVLMDHRNLSSVIVVNKIQDDPIPHQHRSRISTDHAFFVESRHW